MRDVNGDKVDLAGELSVPLATAKPELIERVQSMRGKAIGNANAETAHHAPKVHEPSENERKLAAVHE